MLRYILPECLLVLTICIVQQRDQRPNGGEEALSFSFQARDYGFPKEGGP